MKQIPVVAVINQILFIMKAGLVLLVLGVLLAATWLKIAAIGVGVFAFFMTGSLIRAKRKYGMGDILLIPERK